LPLLELADHDPAPVLRGANDGSIHYLQDRLLAERVRDRQAIHFVPSVARPRLAAPAAQLGGQPHWSSEALSGGPPPGSRGTRQENHGSARPTNQFLGEVWVNERG